jgi:hypothetical protein
MTKIAGSISQRHKSADPDPDPHQNVMDPQHWLVNILYFLCGRHERRQYTGSASGKRFRLRIRLQPAGANSRLR